MSRTRKQYKHLLDRRGVVCCGTGNPECIAEAISAEHEVVDKNELGKVIRITFNPNREWPRFRGHQCPTCHQYYTGRVNEAKLATEESKKRDRALSLEKRPKETKKPWELKKKPYRPQAQMEDR